MYPRRCTNRTTTTPKPPIPDCRLNANKNHSSKTWITRMNRLETKLSGWCAPSLYIGAAARAIWFLSTLPNVRKQDRPREPAETCIYILLIELYRRSAATTHFGGLSAIESSEFIHVEGRGGVSKSSRNQKHTKVSRCKPHFADEAQCGNIGEVCRLSWP